MRQNIRYGRLPSSWKIQFCVLVCTAFLPFAVSSAAAPSEPNVVLELTSGGQCSACPNYKFALFDDGMWSFVGQDSVFFLGQGGTYFDRRLMRSPVPAGADSVTREYILKRYAQYEEFKKFLTNESSVFAQVFRDIERLKLSDLQEQYLTSNDRFEAQRNHVMRLRVTGKGIQKTIIFEPEKAPSALREFVSTLFDHRFPITRNGWAQPAPSFWRSPKAILAVVRTRPDCSGQFAIQITDDAALVIYGWNRLAKEPAFQILRGNADPKAVATIFSSFDNAKKNRTDGQIYEDSLVDSLGTGHQGDILLIYKKNPDAFQGDIRGGIDMLAKIWREQLSALPADPELAKACRQVLVR